MMKKVYPALYICISLFNINAAFANNEIDENIIAYDIVTFDSSSLFGNTIPVNLKSFQTENYIHPGIYRTSLYLNGHNLGEIDTKFEHLDGSHTTVLCIDSILISKIPLNEDHLKYIPTDNCLLIKDIAEDAYYVFNKETLKLELFIPQSYIKEYPKGYINPNLFNKGVNSSFIGYNFNYNKENNNENKYLALFGGINLSDWYFRHTGSFDTSLGGFNRYTSSQNVLYKDLTKINSRLSLGQFNTQNYNIDSIPILGAQISSDAEMLPWSQRSYSPIIENIAYTNALINIYQNGQKIYEKNVPAGPFKISDLITYADGDILLEINETGREKRTYSIPFQSSFNQLKKGRINFNFSLGEYYFNNSSTNDYILQNNINYGFSNNFSGIFGLSITENFYSSVLGGSISTKIGGVYLQIENQKTKYQNKNLDGEKGSIRYKYNWVKNNLNFSTDYEYYNKKYMSLSNFLYEKNFENLFSDNLNYNYTVGLKETFGFYLTKGLTDLNLGSFNIGYRQNNYWEDEHNTDQYYINYSNFYKKINYNINLTKTTYSSNIYKDNLNIYLSINIPLQWENKNLYLNNYVQNTDDQTTLNTRLSGNLGSNNEMNFGLGLQQSFNSQNDNQSITGYINYHLPQTSLSSTMNYSQGTTQFSFSANGAIVAHPYGLSLVGYIPETYTIIHAKDAHGAKIQNAWGVQIDRFGNAIYPFNTPYTFNTISLDPANLPINVNFTNNQTQVIPKKFSAQLALFETQKISNILLNIKSLKNIPIGSQLYDIENNSIGLLGPSTQIIVENENALQHPTKLVWGDENNDSCIISPINFSEIENIETEFFKIINMECI